jgi:hypothetical protein
VPLTLACTLRSRQDIISLRCSAHHTRMITTAWELGGGVDDGRSNPGLQVGAHAGLRRSLPDQIPALQAGDAAGARDQFAALLPIRERVSGAEHPATLSARANLAYWAGQA